MGEPQHVGTCGRIFMVNEATGQTGKCVLTAGHPDPLRHSIAVHDISDGYHTFGELYDHRRALTAVLAGMAARVGGSWRSKAHHPADSPMFEGGYFVVGVDLPGAGTITYHYKLKHWDDFASVPELDHAPKWDGAGPETTVERLLQVARMLAEAHPWR